MKVFKAVISNDEGTINVYGIDEIDIGETTLQTLGLDTNGLAVLADEITDKIIITSTNEAKLNMVLSFISIGATLSTDWKTGFNTLSSNARTVIVEGS